MPEYRYSPACCDVSAQQRSPSPYLPKSRILLKLKLPKGPALNRERDDSMTTILTKGLLVSLESTDGAGKSTLVAGLNAYLEAKGRSVVLTREPGGTALGEAIRSLVLSGPGVKMAAMTEMLLMSAARAQHLTEVIHPALAKGKIVLCDRYIDSTHAYQGGGRGIAADVLNALESHIVGVTRPHLTLLLDLPVEVGRARSAGRTTPDRIEQAPSSVLDDSIRALDTLLAAQNLAE